MSNSSKKLSTGLFILMGLLFIFSMLSIAFSFSSLVKDIVYTTGFLIAIIFILFYRKRVKKEEQHYK
ncbi:hypothetical protein MHI02_03770 [Oceanobacillus sp. FSL K6-0118]|uniref:hypothetical protein n=1 Tax=Oceanobacillus sp. FSL K6-0118 TaxID=2921418 RepID=UPI0030FAE325